MNPPTNRIHEPLPEWFEPFLSRGLSERLDLSNLVERATRTLGQKLAHETDDTPRPMHDAAVTSSKKSGTRTLVTAGQQNHAVLYADLHLIPK